MGSAAQGKSHTDGTIDPWAKEQLAASALRSFRVRAPRCHTGTCARSDYQRSTTSVLLSRQLATRAHVKVGDEVDACVRRRRQGRPYVPGRRDLRTDTGSDAIHGTTAGNAPSSGGSGGPRGNSGRPRWSGHRRRHQRSPGQTGRRAAICRRCAHADAGARKSARRRGRPKAIRS